MIRNSETNVQAELESSQCTVLVPWIRMAKPIGQIILKDHPLIDITTNLISLRVAFLTSTPQLVEVACNEIHH